jgi:asparagine synthase (glutamine-hydrolysing)
MRPRRAGEGCLERFLDFDQRYSMPDGILYKVDRMSMAHAVEVRPPFLDPRIVAFAARLPQRFKISGLETKVVLRRLMRGSLPPNVLSRPKIGFDIPIHEWLRGVLRPLLMSTLNEHTIGQSGLFHWPAVRRLIDDHIDRKANWGYHLWGLVTLILWMQRWNIEAPASSALVFAEQSDALAVEPIMKRQPANYSARTWESPLD